MGRGRGAHRGAASAAGSARPSSSRSPTRAGPAPHPGRSACPPSIGRAAVLRIGRVAILCIRRTSGSARCGHATTRRRDRATSDAARRGRRRGKARTLRAGGLETSFFVSSACTLACVWTRVFCHSSLSFVATIGIVHTNEKYGRDNDGRPSSKPAGSGTRRSSEKSGARAGWGALRRRLTRADACLTHFWKRNVLRVPHSVGGEGGKVGEHRRRAHPPESSAGCSAGQPAHSLGSARAPSRRCPRAG